MNILSHRGWWSVPEEKNTLRAFKRSFVAGYGTETDLRDIAGTLVISHDPPSHGCLTASDFFQCYSDYGFGLPLALNIKSDGIQPLLAECLEKYSVTNYFVFDMSVPDTLGYLKLGLRTFTRQSEFEKTPALYDQVEGVWLDEFLGHWITAAEVQCHLDNQKRVCIVSPDLHKRAVAEEWDDYQQVMVQAGDKCLLCTDLPDQAKGVIYGQN